MMLKFVQTWNFFDPRLTSDGKPYGPQRYKQIVKERYLISKHTHIGYEETLHITPTERAYLLQFIIDDLKFEQEKINEMKQKVKK